MKKRADVVWEKTARGWRRVRDRAPRAKRSEARSERVPRPPEPRRHGAVAEGNAALRELRDDIEHVALQLTGKARALKLAADNPFAAGVALLVSVAMRDIARKRKTKRRRKARR